MRTKVWLVISLAVEVLLIIALLLNIYLNIFIYSLESQEDEIVPTPEITASPTPQQTEVLPTPEVEDTVPPEIIPSEEPVVEDLVNIYDYFTEDDIIMLSKLLHGEASGIKSDMERAAVIWCVLNRYDTTGYACGVSIEYVVTFPTQFTGYNPSHPVLDKNYSLVVDVLTRWVREKLGEEDVGRVLPSDYLWFLGTWYENPQDAHNIFRNKYKDYDQSNIWDWNLSNPYEI